jgi:hypothetical protein
MEREMAECVHELTPWPVLGLFSALTKGASGWFCPGMPEGVRGDLIMDGLVKKPVGKRVYCIFRFMHAKCSTQWPHEAKFSIWPKYCMEMIQIMFGT